MEIKTCADCTEPFCTTCDDEFTHCPDCGDALCGVCSEFALDQRMARCLTCWNDDLTKVRYSNTDDKFNIHKHYVQGHRGRLRE